MSAHATPDSESFQKVLANAFAVQESGMDRESLSVIVALQRSIATGELDVDEAMHLIGEHARNVAHATGIAIGLLKGDQLVYRAGSGSAAPYVGQHVMATLCVSARNVASGEILRVENAETDARIEATICRQFGAKSLLILPIYHEHVLAGVLEVLFDDAHAFQHREVRSYRLMAGLVGEAMSHAVRPEQKKVLAADLSTMLQRIGQIKPQVQKPLTDDASAPAATTNRAICEACGAPFEEARKLRALRRSVWPASKRAKRVPFYKGRGKTAVAVAAVLVIGSWIAYREHRPTSPLGTSALQGSNAIKQPTPSVPAKRVSASSTSNPQTGVGLKEAGRKAARTMPQWVRVGNNELDYVAHDVTVHYFTPKPVAQRALDSNNQVRYVSEDVTVRYFNPKPALQQVLDRNNQVRYISEDVTVHYFTPKRAVAPPAHPVGNPAQPVDR
jgi:GAF domain-containing protein